MTAACYTVAVADSTVIEAVRAAVAAQPDNAALRGHLARLLLDGGRAEEGLREARAALRVAPTDPAALAVAAEAAEAAGEAEVAAGYRELAEVLAGVQAPPPLGGPGLAASPARGELSRAPGESPPAGDEAATPPPGRVVTLRAIEGGGGAASGETEAPEVTLEDVVGMEAAKERLELAFLAPLRNPELRAMYHKSLRGGLLLYGPPGCGKTHLARACAGELRARFTSIGISDVLDMYLGESERRLHELFDEARRSAPCVVFLDEVDALGHKRTQLKHSAGRTLVNQLLLELDDVQSSNRGVFVLAATNHPWDIDTALRRPGRLDRTVLVPPPDEAARRAILELHLSERPAEQIDVGWVAKKTRRFSGADLAHLVDSAAELALARAVKSGKPGPIETRDVKQALKALRPSTEAWLHTARNFATYANEGGAFDDLLEWLHTS